MAVIEVGCAIVRKGGKVLIAQRKPECFLGGYWEFPGGKRHEGESMEQCLAREIREELGLEVTPRKLFKDVLHAYPEKTVRLFFWFCDWKSGEASAVDCADFRWVDPEEIPTFKMIPADDEIIRELIRGKEGYFKV